MNGHVEILGNAQSRRLESLPRQELVATGQNGIIRMEAETQALRGKCRNFRRFIANSDDAGGLRFNFGKHRSRSIGLLESDGDRMLPPRSFEMNASVDRERHV